MLAGGIQTDIEQDRRVASPDQVRHAGFADQVVAGGMPVDEGQDRQALYRAHVGDSGVADGGPFPIGAASPALKANRGRAGCPGGETGGRQECVGYRPLHGRDPVIGYRRRPKICLEDNGRGMRMAENRALSRVPRIWSTYEWASVS